MLTSKNKGLKKHLKGFHSIWKGDYFEGVRNPEYCVRLRPLRSNMKVVSVVGTRPQFIKAAMVSHKLREKCHEVFVHTGQHYDHEMSKVFFDELAIPEPDYNLGVGSGSHGVQTGAMLARIEEVCLQENPDMVLVYGDTNSTLAGALSAAKLRIPVVHIEAGLRSFNRIMPEEINRILTDHLSSLLLCPSQSAVGNLRKEGIHKGVFHVGDVMSDAMMFACERVEQHSKIVEELGLRPQGYILATVHRAENTDNPDRLAGILLALRELAKSEPVVFPVHPRTSERLIQRAVSTGKIHLIDPVGYLDMIAFERHARIILTDSGGIQKEAYWLSIPCVTLRTETEWIETVQCGWNTVVGADPARILHAVQHWRPGKEHPQLYGDGNVALRCVELILGVV